MSEENRKITPFAGFESPHPKTDPAPPLPEESGEEERGTLAGFEAAFDKVSKEFNGSMNELRTLVVEHYQSTRNRLDAHAKTIRAHTAELKALRENAGLPPVSPPSDDL